MSMSITDYVNFYIEQFVDIIKRDKGWIAKDEILPRFTECFDDFNEIIFSQDGLKKYLVEALQDWYGIEVRD